jgi:VIT1/CCC1 family predicted Fe2+/Mn2+ transporter
VNNPRVTYIDRGVRVESERPLGSIVNEAKDEIKDFAQTRVAMLISEMRENLRTIKTAAPTIIVGLLLAATAWLVLTGALISLIWVAFAPSAYAPFLALLIVGLAYLILGGIFALLGYSSLQDKSLVPKRTIEVLKQDRTWFQNEARTQL